MRRSGEFRRVPWRGLLAAWAVVLALSVGLVGKAGAATRFVATTGNDSSNTCLASGSPCKTITHALTQAVANDTISIAAGTYNLALGETFPLTINTNLTLTGAGAGSTILDATGANRRVITATGADYPAQLITWTITGVIITGGYENCASSTFFLGCVAIGGGFGGGIVTLTNSTVSGNTVSCIASESGTCSASGGGLFGIVTLTNSTVSGNTVSCIASGDGTCSASGGGLSSGSDPSGDSLTLTNSTVSGNTVSCTPSEFGCIANGGGISFDGDSLTLTNATITANTITCSGVAPCPISGGGLYGDGTMTLQNTIIAKQVTGSDCANTGTLTSNGFNIDSDGTCQLTQPSDRPNTSTPLLGPLQNNGGPTQTHALLPGSPAIDAVTSGCPPPTTDQRGVARPQGAACDIGAYEFGAIVAAVTLNGLAFHTAQTINYQATLIPGFTPTQVDIYLGALLPDGATFLSLVQVSPGVISFVFGPALTPFLANVPLTQTVVPFSYTFTGVEPVGTYFTYAGLAIAGSDPLQSANQLSLGVQPFDFTP